jgi:hypothetical protein
MGTLGATQAQKPMGYNPALQKSLELVFDKLGQARAGLLFDLSQEGLDVFLDELDQRGLFGPPGAGLIAAPVAAVLIFPAQLTHA